MDDSVGDFYSTAGATHWWHARLHDGPGGPFLIAWKRHAGQTSGAGQDLAAALVGAPDELRTELGRLDVVRAEVRALSDLGRHKVMYRTSWSADFRALGMGEVRDTMPVLSGGRADDSDVSPLRNAAFYPPSLVLAWSTTPGRGVAAGDELAAAIADLSGQALFDDYDHVAGVLNAADTSHVQAFELGSTGGGHLIYDSGWRDEGDRSPGLDLLCRRLESDAAAASLVANAVGKPPTLGATPATAEGRPAPTVGNVVPGAGIVQAAGE